MDVLVTRDLRNEVVSVAESLSVLRPWLLCTSGEDIREMYVKEWTVWPSTADLKLIGGGSSPVSSDSIQRFLDGAGMATG